MLPLCQLPPTTTLGGRRYGGGVLLVAAGSMASQQARNWIVGVMTVMYGLPAAGNLALSGGRPAFGWMALVVVLAALGRQVPIEQAVSA